MPWTIVESHPDCTNSEVAVVKEDADGNADMDELEGCHATEDDALDQIAALEASEENAMDALDRIEAQLDDMERKGEGLASEIEGMIEDMDDDRADVVGAMAQEAGLSRSTVNGILSAEIQCPPVNRLDAFADVLGTSTSTLVSAAEGDGCMYDMEENANSYKSAVGERRTMSFETKGLEVKDDGDEEFVFEGYGAIFGNRDRGGDIIEKGAFRKTIERNDGTFPLLADHEMRMQSRLGVVNAKEDRNGVKVTGHINTQKRLGKEAASDIRHAMKHGDTIGMSFGYQVENDDYDEEEDARILKQVKTHEFSLTQIPMNPEAEVTGIKAFLEDESALEKLARRIAPMLANDERLQKAFGPVSGDESAAGSAQGNSKSPSVAELMSEVQSLTNQLQSDA